MQRLEDARSAAFSNAEVADLDEVYTHASNARGTDEQTVQSMVNRGLHAEGLRMTVASVAVVRRSSARNVTVAVRDRISAYRLVDASGRPAGAGPGRSSRTVVMQLADVAAGWRIVAIDHQSSARRAASMSS